MYRKICYSTNFCLSRWCLMIALILCFSQFSYAQSVPKSKAELQRGREVFRKIQAKIINDTWSKDPSVRCQALIALGRIYQASFGTPTLKPPRSPILDALNRDKDRQVRWTALLILGDIPGNRQGVTYTRGTVQTFQKIVATDRDLDFRRIAAVNLLKWGKMDKHEERIWKYTLEMLEHPDAMYQDYALDALYYATHYKKMDFYHLHPSVKTKIKKMAQSPHPSSSLIRTVSHLWKGNSTPLIKWLKDENYELRKTGALALEKHSRKDGGVALELLDNLRSDSSVKARAAAAKALTGHPRPTTTMSGKIELRRREFSHKMQEMVWNTLVDAAVNDAPQVRTSALLSLANLKNGDESAWEIFTDAMGDTDGSVRRAAALGVGRAIYFQFNEVIEAALIHVLLTDDSLTTRFYAVDSLSLFNYWDETVHSILMEALNDEGLCSVAISLLAEYAEQEPRALHKLRQEFQASSDKDIRLYLAMALVKSGEFDREYIEILARDGLKDAKLAPTCAKLLGYSVYAEPFVIEALLEKLRESLAAVGPYDGLKSLKPITHYKTERKGGWQVETYVLALIRLDKYNKDLVQFLPKVAYLSRTMVRSLTFEYAGHFRWTNTTDDRSLSSRARRQIRQERQKHQ